uniref:Uncharacterized protein n=1 Tax=Rhizophora mucronata TaxID=61149 RepID=A0A2P2QAT4_RHIMU
MRYQFPSYYSRKEQWDSRLARLSFKPRNNHRSHGSPKPTSKACSPKQWYPATPTNFS